MTLMQRRRALMGAQEDGGLPSEYQGCEWISRGDTTNSYVTTDVKVGDVTLVEAELEKISTSTSGPAFIAMYENGSFKFPLASLNNTQSGYVCSPSVPADQTAPKQLYTFTKNKGTQSGYVALLGWSNSLWRVTMRLFWVKIYSSDLLVFDAVPCYRKADGIIGIYDYVSKMFYEGVGTLAKGADI